jgi:predicted nucleotidyltransferase component of viral defense system
VIPAASITAWGVDRPWPSRLAIEQDLLLARLIVAVYDHPRLREELVFRGGTCLLQVHLPAPLRYSEDLDFVRRTHTGIGGVFDDLREVAAAVGLEVRGTDIGEHPKMRLRARAEESPDIWLRIKVEINTHETSPARDLVRVPFTVASPWFTGSTDVLTFTSAELVSTKLRALYQRSKGRDLFDLWLALTLLELDPREILGSFGPYRPDGYTAQLAVANLNAKLDSQAFRRDLDLLVTRWPDGYDIDGAAELIIGQLLSQV